jgi:hypothetical protein
VFPGGCGFLDGPEHLLDRWLEEEPLPGHDVAVDQDGQFAAVTILDVYVEIRLLSQRRCQTGSVSADAASDRALSDGYFLHRTPPFHASGVKCRRTDGQITCRRRSGRFEWTAEGAFVTAPTRP